MGVLRFLSGVIVGALVGAVTTLLLTPQSGEEFQQRMREQAEQIVEEGRRAAAERRAELEAQFAQAKRTPPRAA
jgi:gas vesicle protein